LRDRAVPRRLRQVQTDWARVADIFHIHRDLTEGGQQRHRGGPSIGKAIAVVAGSIRARGAHAANLWRAWKENKDVAHLVTAATIISDEVRRRAKVKSFGEFGLDADRLGPFTVAMMMPDFVLSLALSFQEYGLNSTPQSREQPMLDPENLWRIAPEMNVVAVPPPFRKISDEAIAILDARRAGNRGKAERSKTPPVTTGTGISAPASGAATAEYGMPDGTVVDPVVNDGNKDKLQRHRRRGRQRTPVLSGALQPREDDRAAEEEARGVPATGAEPSLPRLLQFLAEVH
jgi:hypothetical protein